MRPFYKKHMQETGKRITGKPVMRFPVETKGTSQTQDLAALFGRIPSKPNAASLMGISILILPKSRKL